MISRVAIFAGSSMGQDPRYRAAAQDLARLLAARRIGIVYGGAGIGLMGVLADAALAAGAEVIGVIPRMLAEKELAHPSLTELRIAESMHERKALMAELADGFIALPGGPGTLEELLEIWAWGQLGLHRKPCGLINVTGYYDGLAAFLDAMVRAGFLSSTHRAMLIIEHDPHALLDRFTTYRAPAPKFAAPGLSAGGEAPRPMRPDA